MMENPLNFSSNYVFNVWQKRLANVKKIPVLDVLFLNLEYRLTALVYSKTTYSYPKKTGL